MKVSAFTIKHLAKIVCGDSGYTPYLSGPRLVELFNRYGFRETYGAGFPSRWAFTEEKLASINDTPALEKIIEEIIDPRHFFETDKIIEEAVLKVNDLLKHDGFSLQKKGDLYKIFTVNPVSIKAEDIAALENDYLTEQIHKCEDKISSSDYDGAITNARTLAEAVMVDILKKYEPEYVHAGDLTAAYKHIKKLLNIDPSTSNYPEPIKQILSGLNSIVIGLAAIRNEMSDAHARKYKPGKHHAVLAVNSSKTLCVFLLHSLSKQFSL
ncbi:MAG: abortive infection family protein [Spirochaetales bacterium]|nr:abortive infection family protein [Spirochaetales bacterium]